MVMNVSTSQRTKLYTIKPTRGRRRRYKLSHQSEKTDTKLDSNPNSRNHTFDKKNFKTELCRSFLENCNCKYGKDCQFAHGVKELKARSFEKNFFKTERCLHFQKQGRCQFGSRCRFLHDEIRTHLSDKITVLHSPSECLLRAIIKNNDGTISVLSHPYDISFNISQMPSNKKDLWKVVNEKLNIFEENHLVNEPSKINRSKEQGPLKIISSRSQSRESRSPQDPLIRHSSHVDSLSQSMTETSKQTFAGKYLVSPYGAFVSRSADESSTSSERTNTGESSSPHYADFISRSLYRGYCRDECTDSYEREFESLSSSRFSSPPRDTQPRYSSPPREQPCFCDAMYATRERLLAYPVRELSINESNCSSAGDADLDSASPGNSYPTAGTFSEELFPIRERYQDIQYSEESVLPPRLFHLFASEI